MTIRAGLQVLLGIAYPAIVFFALGRVSPRSIAFLIVALALLRILLARRGRSLRDGLETVRSVARDFWLPVASIAVVVSATAAWNDPLGLLLVPALISLSLLVTFALSLRSERSMIERFARMQVDTLSLAEQRYCRRVTIVWCGFFAAKEGAPLARQAGVVTSRIEVCLHGLSIAVIDTATRKANLSGMFL